MPRLSKIGAAALAAFGWTGLQTVTASYLVVAGGGGGGTDNGGGGGAGGYLETSSASLNLTLSYTVVVGAGGAGGASPSGGRGSTGSDSSFSASTANGGGGGGGPATSSGVGGNGGSGGGGDGFNAAVGGTATQGNSGGATGYGNNGGTGDSGGANRRRAGGGGGASAAGENGSAGAGSLRGGNGGAGRASSISGSSVTYAGGGGGGNRDNNSSGGAGGGGGGGGATVAGTAGTANTGGGGGGGGDNAAGAQGGSGIVIISYTGPQQFGGGVVTSSGGKTIHTFTTSGTLSPIAPLTASYLIVAGGGSGSGGGGGGAGGMQTGSGLVIDTNSVYLVTVGAGGASTLATNNSQGSNGSNSVFSAYATASVGGGGGGFYNSGAGSNGSNGGSGGGGGGSSGPTTSGGVGTSGQGNNGGTGFGTGGRNPSGGGGGAGAVGGNATSASTSTGGSGGNGLASSISGTSTTYAGGGGGAGDVSGSGGTGGGGSATTVGAGVAGTANLGGGGGGVFNNYIPGAGGSGIVIISYPGSTQQMAGGTVTVAGGNVIHTFTSSGYLSPIVTLNKSLRFRRSASAYLNRTPTVAGNRQKFTISMWVKRGDIENRTALIGAGTSSSGSGPGGSIYFNSSGGSYKLELIGAGGTSYILVTTQVFRDPSSWYHLVFAFDTTQSTSNERIKVYVNGVQITAFSTETYPSQNFNTDYNNTAIHAIGSRTDDGTPPVSTFDGCMTEINLIDGQQLTPNSFGSFNGLGVWQPIRYGGSYGTNGFYLPFTDTTSTTTLGYDFSPNGNNWTPNNISLTSGVTYDSMTDVPTNTSATVANYCVMNPLTTGSLTTLSGANLNLVQTSGSSVGNSRSSFAMLTGKWYFETTLTAANVGIYPQLGIMTARDGSRPNNDYPQAGYSTSSLDPTLSVIYMADGTKQTNNSASAYGSSFTNGDVIGIAIDSDNGAIYFSKNGVFQNSGVPTSGASKTGAALTWTGGTVEHVYSVAGYNGTAEAVNFGQRPFTYTPPSGFVALNTFNLPTPTIGATPATTANKYFDVILYTGNGASNRSVSGLNFQPDFMWNKARNNAYGHKLYDAVRGVTKLLASQSTDAESTTGTAFLVSFDSTGVTIGNDTGINGNGVTFVDWFWNAGGSNATNTAGTITSTVRANTTAGFSIVTYTGNGTNATVGHGLGASPSMIIVKKRSAADPWPIYHITTGVQQYIFLNATDAVYNNLANYWGSTSPSSTTFGLGPGYGGNNSNGSTYVAYCFAPIAGYSAFGSYTGNGSSDGPFVFTGFRPRYIMIKRTDASNDWVVLDTSRNTFNVMTSALFPNSSSSETSNGFYDSDMLSNGIKIRATNAVVNASGGTYIYMAFAESPFKYANAR